MTRVNFSKLLELQSKSNDVIRRSVRKLDAAFPEFGIAKSWLERTPKKDVFMTTEFVDDIASPSIVNKYIDRNGKVLGKVSTRQQVLGDKGWYNVIEYDDAGRVSKELITNDGTIVRSVKKNQYDHNGKLIKTDEIIADDHRHITEFDPMSGKPKKFSWTYNNGLPGGTITY